MRDINGIIRYSRKTFGDEAALLYRSLVLIGIETLAKEPVQRTAKTNKNVRGGAWVYHLRHVRQPGPSVVQRPRHVIAYVFDAEVITIIRVLHDAMDLPRHLRGR